MLPQASELLAGGCDGQQEAEQETVTLLDRLDNALLAIDRVGLLSNSMMDL